MMKLILLFTSFTIISCNEVSLLQEACTQVYAPDSIEINITFTSTIPNVYDLSLNNENVNLNCDTLDLPCINQEQKNDSTLKITVLYDSNNKQINKLDLIFNYGSNSINQSNIPLNWETKSYPNGESCGATYKSDIEISN